MDERQSTTVPKTSKAIARRAWASKGELIVVVQEFDRILPRPRAAPHSWGGCHATNNFVVRRAGVGAEHGRFDAFLSTYGLVLYDALYAWCRSCQDETQAWPPKLA